MIKWIALRSEGPVFASTMQTLKKLETNLVPNKDTGDGPEYYEAGPGSLAIYTCSSPDKDKPNEDRIAIIPYGNNSLILMIADGAGGHASGDTASATAIKLICKSIMKTDHENSELREAILAGIETANTELMNSAPGSATTISLAEIHRDTVRTYHAGDTEIIVTGLKGKLKYQTLIHSPVGYAVEAGLLDEADAIMHEDRHIVSNVLGFSDMHITIGSPFRLDTYDTLLIATDGLFDNLQKDEILELIRKGPLKDCANNLVAMTSERMFEKDREKPSKIDDLSFILFRPKRATERRNTQQ